MADRKARPGEARAFFDQHVADETDECVVWPFGADRYGKLWTGGRNEYVHTLACATWHGPRPAGMHATHGPCNNPRCFNGAHLSWQTPSGNMADKLRDGTYSPPPHRPGEGNGSAKLTETQVRTIRERYGTTLVTQTALANRYGVSQSLVHAIVRGKNWTHL